MTTHDDLDHRLKIWFDEGARGAGSARTLEIVVNTTRARRSRPVWVVALRGDGLDVGWPRTSSTVRISPRFAAAAVVAALAIGGALYLIGATLPLVGSPSPTPGANSSPSLPAVPSGKAGSWTVAERVMSLRDLNTATLLSNGKVLVAGGRGGNGDPIAFTELYDPASGSWTASGRMVGARAGHTATLLADGRVLVVGGSDSLGSNHVLQGPQSSSNGLLATTELYDPASGSWTATGAMAEARIDHTATLLPDGKVLVAGGYGGASGQEILASAELFDPATGSWAMTGPMNVARARDTATLLADGTVLVVGGASSTLGAVDSAEIYSPSSGSWSTTGQMIVARSGQTATRLHDGMVLVAGGDALASAELFNPGSGAWTATGPMASAFAIATATLLPDGRVLVVGKSLDNGLPDSAASAELYDAQSGSWAAAPNLTIDRTAHTATLLDDGRVFVTGGDYFPELYDPRGGS
jgi:hypothetical protein